MLISDDKVESHEQSIISNDKIREDLQEEEEEDDDDDDESRSIGRKDSSHSAETSELHLVKPSKNTDDSADTEQNGENSTSESKNLDNEAQEPNAEEKEHSFEGIQSAGDKLEESAPPSKQKEHKPNGHSCSTNDDEDGNRMLTDETKEINFNSVPEVETSKSLDTDRMLEVVLWLAIGFEFEGGFGGAVFVFWITGD